MTAVVPSREAGEQVNLTVTVAGATLDTDRLVSVETWSEANRIPRARLVLYDGEPDTQKFPFSESDKFVPGSKIVVAAGYGSASKTLHSGIVVKHALRIAPGTSAQLVVETADPLLKMTLTRNSTVSQQKSDHDVIAALVAAGGGSVGKNEASASPMEALVQYHASDWDLLLMRAEASGCVVLFDGGKVNIVSPGADSPPVLKLEYGDSIVSLDAVIDASSPRPSSEVKRRSWSYNQQKRSEGSAQGGDVTTPGNLGAEKLAGTFSLGTAVGQTGAYVADDRLGDWATADLMRSRLGAVQGQVRFQGTSAVKPGDFVSLAGLGARFNGTAFVGGVRHVIRDGGWQTIVAIGLAAESFASARSDVAAPPAAGLLPPVRGLQTGQVKQVAADPSGDYRVLVTLPLVDPDTGVWARLAQFYASKDFGAAFFPEVGDEVVLGFMEEDPTSPVILGSVYSSQRGPTVYPPDEPNDVKSLITRSGIELKFDDKDTIFHIKTPKGRIVTLDDKAGEITIVDPFNNKILMNEQKVDVISGAELNLTSKTNMTINSGAKLTVEATGAFSLTAASNTQSAKGMMSISANATGELKASAPLTISGAIVKIN